MEHKLKKPVVYKFKVADANIAYLTLASKALFMNTSANWDTAGPNVMARTKEFRMSSIEGEDSRIF